jgi:hypothetical protein
MRKHLFFLIVLFFILTIGNSQALSNSLCVIINKGATNPLCMFLQNMQADIGSDCADGYCVYGVQENGTLNCRVCSSGGGEGANFWQTGDGWMFPNTTAGGLNDVNVSILKADTIYENGVSLISRYSNITWGYNQIQPAIDWVTSQGYLTSFTELDPYYFSNPYNYLNSSFNSTYNTYAYNQTLPAINYFNSNPYNWINSSFNSTYNDYITKNVSSISNNSLYFNGYSTSLFQNGTELTNITTEMQIAVNNSGSYNITSWQTNYVNNATERTSFTNTYNKTYDDKFNTTATSNLNMNSYNISSIATINLTSGICIKSNATYKLIIESC